jgi:16S rRNA processing protein RimM
MEKTTEWATIGRIVGPFGIRGEVKVFSLSDIPDRFTTVDTVYLGEQRTPHKIKAVRPYKGELVVMKLTEIDDATTAEKLREQELFIPIEAMAILPPDSYYQHDIIGLQVFLLDGTLVGTITDIMSAGGNDVYTINTASGKQVLVPAVKEFIKQVDLIRHVMYIDPIKGLLDDEEATADDPDQEV